MATTFHAKAIHDPTQIGNVVFVDEQGDRWFVFGDDGNGNYAVDREDGQQAAFARWDDKEYGTLATLWMARGGDTFDESGPANLIVQGDAWRGAEPPVAPEHA